jgi:imidazolonepropionase
MKTLLGSFAQLLTMRNLPIRGALNDSQLEIIPNGGIIIENGEIVEIGEFNSLHQKYKSEGVKVQEVDSKLVALPGFVDAHTHICFGGSRAMDFAARNGGKSYLEIAKSGGGIWSTVKHTRQASQAELIALTKSRMDILLQNGITTVEVKSGYGLSLEEELKMLRAIKQANSEHQIDTIATCLSAHIVPKDFEGGEQEYLDMILQKLVPIIEQENLCKRFDAFIEDSAFSESGSEKYLKALKQKGFDLTVHGDQFTTGGSQVAINCGARSVDHLEASGEKEIANLAKSQVVPVALPGASLGVGCAFTPARKLLDAGCSLAIASDWNPGSAPQGNLLAQASILSCFEKLSSAEVLAAMTFRAGNALGIGNIGKLETGFQADLVTFPTSDYREILYHQGELKATKVWKKGNLV